MQVKTKVFTSLLVILLVTALMQVSALADSMGFSVSPNIPANQRGSTSSYFDLLVQPGQQQDLSVTVTNESEDEIVVKVEAYAASTNRNGVVVYDEPDAPMDDSAPFNFGDIVQVNEEYVTIPAGTTTDIVVNLNIPDESFDGVALGAIQVTKELSEEEKESGAMILNQYSFVTAVQLAMNENEVVPDFRLGDVEADLINYRAGIVANVHNTQATIVRNASITAQVYPSGSDTPAFEVSQTNIDIAPSSILPFSIPDEAGYGIDSGDYIIQLQIQTEDNSWDLEQEFTIAAQEAASVNANAVNQNEQTRTAGAAGSGFPLWAIIAVAALVLVAIIVVVIIIRKGKGGEYVVDLNNPPER